MKVLFWHVLIETRKAEKTTKGGIVLPDDVEEADNLLTQVGRVVGMGPMAFKTKTPGGHDYSIHVDDVKEGAWVTISRKIGIPIKTRDGRTFHLCNDYEILAVLTEDEAQEIKGYV